MLLLPQPPSPIIDLCRAGGLLWNSLSQGLCLIIELKAPTTVLLKLQTNPFLGKCKWCATKTTLLYIIIYNVFSQYNSCASYSLYQSDEEDNSAFECLTSKGFLSKLDLPLWPPTCHIVINLIIFKGVIDYPRLHPPRSQPRLPRPMLSPPWPRCLCQWLLSFFSPSSPLASKLI